MICHRKASDGSWRKVIRCRWSPGVDPVDGFAMGKTPPELKNRPVLKFEKEELKRFALSGVAVLILVLLALLFDTRIEEVKKKEVSVVYRPKPILRVRPKPKPVTKASKESAKKIRKEK